MRKKRAEKKFIKPDPKYNDFLVAKLINYLTWHGKKSTARNIENMATKQASLKILYNFIFPSINYVACK